MEGVRREVGVGVGMRDRHVRRRLGRIGGQSGVGIQMRGAPTWLVE